MSADVPNHLVGWPTTRRGGQVAFALGAAAAAIAVGVLTLWLVPGHGGALVMKTNTALGLLLAASSVLAWTVRGPRKPGLPALLAVSALAIGLATQLQYVTGTDFGIDQLLARELIAAESGRFPNRMSPMAALGLMLVGPALLLLPSRSARCEQLTHGFLLALLVLNGVSLLGYLYGTSFLYRPLPFIRISPYTNAALVAVASGALALRPDVGLTRLLVDPGAPGVLVRRLLVVIVPLPVLVGWVFLRADQLALIDVAARSALLVIATVLVLVIAVMVAAREVAALERQRAERVEDLRREAAVAGAFASAFTLEQVCDATVRVAAPAFGAAACGLYLRAPDGQRLTLAASFGHTPEVLRRYAYLTADAAVPQAEAARFNEPRFIASPAAFHERYATVTLEDVQYRAWAAMPLAGRDRALGVLALSFDQERSFDAAESGRLRLLASQCAQALDRALLFDSAARARAAERAASQRLENASRAKDEFLAMFGHELRNPLAPITTAIGLMKMRGGDVLHKERSIIERQVQHMTRLIDDLLDVSRIARGKVMWTPQRVEIGEAVSRAVETVSPLLEERGHDLALDVDAELPVMGDPHRLAQVIGNLIGNAAKYTPAGGHVAVRARRAADRVELTVEDDGVGIPGELLPRIFDIFTQGERGIERAQGGLGLGLTIVKNLVQLHGGTVQAASPGPGHGSVFTVRLPAAPLTQPVAPAQAEPELHDVSRTARRRILVVDDNNDAAEMLAELLRQVGHAVEVAFDGPSALAAAEAFRPELVFLDIGLPVMDGYEVGQRLRQTQPAPLQLVAVTGYGQAADRERTRQRGFDEHLVKPLDVKRALEIAAGA